MARIECQIEIGGAPDDVFAFATMPALMPVWMSSVLLTTCTGPSVLGPGTNFRQHWKLLGRVLEMTYEVLEYDPDRAFAYQGITGPVGCFVRSSFVPLPTGTNLTWCAELDLRAVYRRQTLLALRVARHLLQADLLTLKAVLERRENRNDFV